MEIKTFGVVGAGQMGSGIAQVCAQIGYRVILSDISDEIVAKGLGRIDNRLAKFTKEEEKDEILGKVEKNTGRHELIRGGTVRRVINFVFYFANNLG